MKCELLNFTICQMLVVIGVLAPCVRCQEQKAPEAAGNVTFFDRSFEKVLSRRKRFLLWRPGSNVLLTGSLSKPLAFPRPGGHNLIIEWDIFYPLPSSWYKPKKPAPPPPPPPPPTTVPPELIESWDHHGPHSGEIWVPPGGWTSDVLGQLKGQDNRRIWRQQQQQQRPQLRQGDGSANNLFRSASPVPVTQYRNPLLRNYNQPWQQSKPLARHKQINFNQQNYQSPPQSSSDAQKAFTIANEMNYGRRGRSIDKPDDDWEHHHAHRDRRDLYERLANALPALATGSFDMKSCLLRTICEAQHFLHPPGYSMLQDMLRVIFTIPIKDDMEDDYARAMQANDQDCVRVYSEKCPMSILAFLLQAKN